LSIDLYWQLSCGKPLYKRCGKVINGVQNEAGTCKTDSMIEHMKKKVCSLHMHVPDRATLKPGNRNPDFGTGTRNREPETRIRNPESGIHKSKKTSSSNTRKLFSIAFACKKKSCNQRTFRNLIITILRIKLLLNKTTFKQFVH